MKCVMKLLTRREQKCQVSRTWSFFTQLKIYSIQNFLIHVFHYQCTPPLIISTSNLRRKFDWSDHNVQWISHGEEPTNKFLDQILATKNASQQMIKRSTSIIQSSPPPPNFIKVQCCKSDGRPPKVYQSAVWQLNVETGVRRHKMSHST